MANRRMFSLNVVDTDRFLDMPASAQALYFHLGMRADDDGFVSSPTKILKMIGAAADDFKLLLAKGYVIRFDSGICVITDWKLNNYLRSDRHTATIHTKEMLLLSGNDNGSYKLCLPDGIPSGNQTGGTLATQYSIGKGNNTTSSPPSDSTKKNPIVAVFCDDSDAVILSKLLYDHIARNDPKSKQPNFQTWAKDADLLLRIDGRTKTEVAEVIAWCQADSFWKSNILSMKKLQKQFPALLLRMRGNGPTVVPTVTAKRERFWDEENGVYRYWDGTEAGAEA